MPMHQYPLQCNVTISTTNVTITKIPFPMATVVPITKPLSHITGYVLFFYRCGLSRPRNTVWLICLPWPLDLKRTHISM